MSILDTETRNGYAIVSAQDTAAGDVTLHVGVYIENADMDWRVKSAEVQWSVSDSSWVYTKNIGNLYEKNTNSQGKVEAYDASYSGGTYSTYFVVTPYCFTYLAANREYTRNIFSLKRTR